MTVIDEETYLAINGASRQNIGEPALHKNRGRHSDKTWRKIVDSQASKDHELLSKRAYLRTEYQNLIEKGEIRPPSSLETLLGTCSGHPDNDSTQAARRILLKRFGSVWREGLTIEEVKASKN